MQDRTWKTALWDTSWDELYEGKFSEEGTCRFTKNGGASLEIPFGDISKTRILKTTGRYTEGIEPKRFDHLFGITQDGNRLALCNALSRGVGESIPGSTFETFCAPTVLASRSEFDPAAPMISAQFEIALLNDWLGLRYSPVHREDTYTFNFGTGSLSLPLHISSDACVEIRAGIKRPRETASGTSIPYYCHICVEYPYGKVIDEIWRTELWRLQSLLAFCFGTYPEITSAKVRQERDGSWIHVYRSSANTGRGAKLSPQPPIPFHQLGRDGLLQMAENWIALGDDEWHAAQMLTSLFGSWNMPLDLELLAATTMFESLIRANRPPLFGEEELETISKPIIEAADEKVRKRVAGLIKLLDKPSYTTMLNEAYEESKPWGEHLIPRWSKFRDEQYALRVGGAHGISSDKDPYLRIDHYHAQIVLAYFILMKRLCLPPEAIDQFERSSFLNASRWDISRRYSRPKPETKTTAASKSCN